MKSVFLLILCTLCTDIISQAQVNKYYQIRTSTELYSSAEKDAKPIGVFARGSRVLLLSNNKQRLQVETNTQIVGYINHGSLVEHLNGNDSYEQDPEIFRGGINGQYFENRGLYTTVAGLRARAQPSTTGLVIKQLNMNHHCLVDFIPYDPNGWVCGGTIWDGEGDFTFYVPVKYVGKQTDIAKVIAQYNTDKGKSEATDKLLAERILEMSHWESDSLRLELLRVFKEYCTTYAVAFDLTDIDFEIFVLEAIGFEEKYELNEAWSFSVNAQELDLSSEKTLQSRNLNFTTTSEWPEELGECGWEFKKEFYAEGISIIDEGPEYGLTMWKLDFSHRNIAAKIAGTSIDYSTDEKAFVQQLGWLISSTDLRQTGQHRYYFHNGDAGFYSVVFENGKPVSWIADYYC